MLPAEEGTFPVKRWLRLEWQRSGLPLYKANEACYVKNAATRKYLTQDWLWYWPPGDAVAKMAAYCKEHGKETSRPYFSLDGVSEIDAGAWDALRATWNHKNGLTNVWTRPPLADGERVKRGNKNKTLHLNQKPLEFMERQVYAASNPGEIVWEPFGGLCSASVASVKLGRYPYAAEVNREYQNIALERLNNAAVEVESGRDG
jgi:site-specific DNA-methyltransferase (adenine-specific)